MLACAVFWSRVARNAPPTISTEGVELLQQDITEVMRIGGDECTVILRRVDGAVNFGLSLASNGDAEVTLDLAIAADVFAAIEHFCGLAAIGTDPLKNENDGPFDSSYGELSFGGESEQGSWLIEVKKEGGVHGLTLVTNELGDVRRIPIELDGLGLSRIITSAKKILETQS